MEPKQNPQPPPSHGPPIGFYAPPQPPQPPPPYEIRQGGPQVAQRK